MQDTYWFYLQQGQGRPFLRPEADIHGQTTICKWHSRLACTTTASLSTSLIRRFLIAAQYPFLRLPGPPWPTALSRDGKHVLELEASGADPFYHPEHVKFEHHPIVRKVSPLDGLKGYDLLRSETAISGDGEVIEVHWWE